MNPVDIWRNMNPNCQTYTWKSKNNAIKCRLDYCLVKDDVLQNILKCRILPSIASDHDIVELTFKLETHIRGKDLWKFNNSLLAEPDYVLGISTLIVAL